MGGAPLSDRRRPIGLVCLWVVLCLRGPGIAAQSDDPVVSAGDVTSMVGAAALLLGPTLLFDADSVTCAPCDRMDVPAFDRWAIHSPRRLPDVTSDVLAVAMAASSWLDLSNEGRAGQEGIVTSIQSLAYAGGVTEVLKAVAGRRRPVLYTEDGIAVAGNDRSQRGWPSFHAAGAAALATSYWLTRDRISGRGDTHAWLLTVTAVGIGVLRVAAGEHFPSDVLSGWAVGVGTAVVVHAVKF